MNNPALRIWFEGQIVYASLHGIAIVVSIPISVWNGADVIPGVAAISALSVLFEFFFALPALPAFAVWLRLLKLVKTDRYTTLTLSLLVYMATVYYCARLLWYWLNGSWELRGGDADFFYLFTAAALVSAGVGLIINHRKLREYMHPDTVTATETKSEHITITPQTDNNYES